MCLLGQEARKRKKWPYFKTSDKWNELQRANIYNVVN